METVTENELTFEEQLPSNYTKHYGKSITWNWKDSNGDWQSPVNEPSSVGGLCPWKQTRYHSTVHRFVQVYF